MVAKRSALASWYGLALCTLVGCSGDGADAFTPTGTSDRADNAATSTLLAADATGTAALDHVSPLVDRLIVRVRGSGWQPNTRLRIQQCYTFGDSIVYPVCDPYGRARTFVTTDANGAFKSYEPLRTDFGTLALPSGPFVQLVCGSNCVLRIGDDQNFDATMQIVPLSFVNTPTIDVVSNYEPEWQGLLEEGLRISGLPASDLQRTGAAVTMWILRAAGASGSPIARTGSISYTTTYTQDDYRALSAQAAEFDYTLDEVQKVGALFWSWLLAGQPAR